MASFNICSYNVQMRPILDNVCYKAKRIGPRLNQFDIACLQEGFAGDHKLAKYTNHIHKVNPDQKRNCFTIVDSGLLTLSNFDLKAVHFEVYNNYATFQDFIASKGVLMTRWNINGCLVDVYNTHMQAGNGQEGLDAARSQILQLIKAVNTHTPPENGLIVLGDFNMSPIRPGKTNLELLPQPMYDDDTIMIHRTTSFNMMVTQLNLTDVYDIFYPGQFDYFDRCLFRSGIKVKLVPNSIKSDKTFLDENGNMLSDAWPLVINITVSKS